MNEIHESNRHHWDRAARKWEELRDEDGLWRRCHKEPDLAFEGGELRFFDVLAHVKKSCKRNRVSPRNSVSLRTLHLFLT